MRSMNARVVFADTDTGMPPRPAVEHKNVKIVLELGWLVLEDPHGERTIYPEHAVSRIEAKPTSYDRGSW